MAEEANSQPQQPQQQQPQQTGMPPPPPAPPQQPPQQQPPGNGVDPSRPNNQRGGGRGNQRGGRGRGGGRTSAGGRTIYNSNSNGRGRGGRGGGPPGQPGVQNISASTGVPFGHVPAYLPGSSSLVEQLDQRIMIVLRDGRHLVGNLRSFDQFSNMVLDSASERRFHSDEKDSNKEDEKKITYYTDVVLGMYIVRGDSIVLLGQVGPEDEEQESTAVSSIAMMKKVDNETFEDLVAAGDDEGPENNGDPEGADKPLEWDFDKDLLA